MADRRETPDILGAVLGGDAPATSTSKPASQHDSKPARRRASKTASQKASTPADQPASKPTKATFYLSTETLEAMEDGLHQLRKLAGKDRSRVTKSALVETALVAALSDLAKKGPASQLASKLVGS